MATLSSTNRLKLTYMEEATFGDTPSAGDIYGLRNTGESFNFEYSKESSNEINPSRGISSVIPLDAEASGSLNGEMQYAEYDRFLAATLQNPWTTYGTDGESADLDLTLTKSAGTIVASPAPNSQDKFDLLAPGQWFTLEDSAGNIQVLRVASSTDDTITLDTNTGVEDNTLTGAKIRTSRLKNGVTQKFFSIQREVSDASEFFLYRGMTPNVLNLSQESGSFTTVSFDFMGKNADASSSNLFPAHPNGVAVDSFKYDVMSSVTGSTCLLWVDGKPLSGTFVESIDLTYDNSLRAQKALCTLGAIGMGNGVINCTIDLSIYFASGRTFYDELLDNSDVEIAFSVFDPENNGYVFTLPRGNVSTYSLNGDGGDQDLMASITVTGLLYKSNTPALNDSVLFIDRIGEAVDLS